MPAQASGDVRQDDVAVIQFDGKRRAWKDLFDAAEDLERRFLGVLGKGCGFRGPRAGLTSVAIASSYRACSFTVPGARKQTLDEGRRRTGRVAMY